MKWRWRVSHVVAVALLGLGLTCVGRAEDPPPSCEDAVDARDWQRVVDVCVGAGWEAHARLGQAWLDRGQDRMKAFSVAESLICTSVATDAHFLAGYIAGADTKREFSDDQARQHLQLALEGYLEEGRHGGASRAAAGLSRVPRREARFETALRMADLAFAEAEKSGENRVLGQAWQARARVYDSIGRIRDARDAFAEAQKHYDRPDDLAFAYFYHALFVVDLGEPELAVELLDRATELREQAKESGFSVGDLDFAIPLNRAVALSLQGKILPARLQLETIDLDLEDSERSKLALVQGLVAARAGDLDAAQRWFDDAGTDELETDYAWTAATELAALYANAGRIEDARRLYRKAIAIIEQMRTDPTEVDLRPWILARRRQPYVKLLDLLASNGYGAEALEVAESLHARALLDVVVSRRNSHAAESADAVRDAELRLRALSAPSLSKDELLRLVGVKEALVFVTVDDGFWRFHVAGGRVTSQHFGPEALRTIEAYRGDLDNVDAATRAGDILLPAALTSSDQPLILVGDVAWQTPFAALRWGRDLFRDARSTAYLPGLAALGCNEQRWDESRVVLGDADGDLPAAAGEVRNIAARFSTAALTGTDATWAALAQAKTARLLHVAVHGRASSSGMALDLRDAEITPSQILAAGIAPAEVILSGCNTADAVGTPESWSGFPSAFLTAGARFVISTLQSVGDEAAAMVVAEYYRQRASLDPPQAVTAAQRAVGGRVPTKDWASFTAWGSPSCELP